MGQIEVIDVAICKDGGVLPLHPRWLDEVLIDIRSKELRSAILEDKRFGERIVGELLRLVFGDLSEGPPDMTQNLQMVALIGRLNRELMTRLGQIWWAPALAEHLLDCTERSKYLLSDRDSMRLIMKYRKHCSPDILQRDCTHPGYEREGAICLIAWLEKHAPTASRRFRLTQSPDIEFDPSTSAARVSLVNDLLADDALAAVAS